MRDADEKTTPRADGSRSQRRGRRRGLAWMGGGYLSAAAALPVLALAVALALAASPAPARAQGAGAPDDVADSDLTRLGVTRGSASEPLVRGVRGLLRVRRQLAPGSRGELARYRDAVDGYAQFLKRDNLSLAREAFLRARVAYERLDREWIERMVARLDAPGGIPDLSPRDAAKLAETRGLAREIAGALGQIADLAAERRRFEMEMDRSFRNLVRLHEEARRIREDLVMLSPPPGVLFLFEEIDAVYATELRPLRVREEGLRSLHGRLEDRFVETGRGARLQAIRAALGKVRAIERAYEGQGPEGTREHR